VKSGRSDALNAEAVCEAVQRPTMGVVIWILLADG
jgi:hypothetical protein